MGQDPAKGGTTPTTSGTECCSLKATCAAYTCPTGFVLKTSRCSSNDASCTHAGCCEWADRSSCSSFTVPSGYKLKPNPGSIYCAVTTCNTANCCDLNPDLCGGAAAVACTTPATQYWDATKCAAVYKAKASAASIHCLGASAT